MDALKQRLASDARYLGNGIVKVDSFLNHCVDTLLLTEVGRELAQQLATHSEHTITRVLTAETSGIVPALTTAQALGVPMVYARKKKPVMLTAECYQSSARSHTKGDLVTLHVSSEYLAAEDCVVIVDDFLGFGNTVEAMLDIVEQSGATLCGVGFVLEKLYEHGRQHLRRLQVPVISLAAIDLHNEQIVVI
jgi:xanthine phosphoribosyltransferase